MKWKVNSPDFSHIKEFGGHSRLLQIKIIFKQIEYRNEIEDKRN